MIAPDDLEHCRQAIKHGSLSFHAAGQMLPHSVRDPALALYAFCRLADDEVDLTQAKADAVLDLQDRLSLVYAGTPRNAPTDRAFTAMVDEFEMPRALPEALLEGLAWDAEGRRYETFSDLVSYSARVASAVGAMMCVLMRVRDRDVLARACDLGVAMQLTNIARDVGEDALEGRLYLPLEWLDEVDLAPEHLIAHPAPTDDVRRLVKRLLQKADHLYARSESGIKGLPLRARTGIFAARFIYAAIGKEVARADYDSISQRARTTKGQKSAWLTLSVVRAMGTLVMPRSPLVYAPVLPEVAFLVNAAADKPAEQSDWSDKMLETFSQLAERDASRRDALAQERSSPI